MKKIKTIVKSVSVLAASCSIIAPVSLCLAKNQFTNSIQPKAKSNPEFLTNTQAISDITETATTFTFKDNKDVPWAGTKFANQVTPEELALALKPADPSANFFVTIEQITENDLLNGVVKFKLYQNLRTFKDGVQTKIEQKLIMPSTSSPPVPYANGSIGNDVWTTQSQTGLVKSKKYQFGYLSDSEIGNFVLSSNKKFSDLTKEDVYYNLLNSSLNLPPLDKMQVTFSDLDNISNSKDLYGVGKINITFTNNDNEWVSGAKPNNGTSSKILRGLLTNANTREVMQMQFSSENISSRIISTDGLQQYSPFLMSTTSAKFGDLFASQFLSANNGNNQTLIQIMTNNLYSQNGTTNNTPLASLSYMGQNINSTDFYTKTGLSETDFKDKLKIKSIEPSINDGLGSMSLVYNFDYLDIFTNTIKSGTASQNFPDGTFRKNVDAGKNLIFEWKPDEMVAGSSSFAGIGTSFDIVNNYYFNQNNPEYLVNLSNQFFNGSSDTYSKSRTVKIDYSSGGKYDSLTGTYVPDVTSQRSIEVTITFDTWNGNIYSPSSPTTRSKQYGFTSTKKFELKNYNYQGQETVNWTKQENLFNQYPFLNTITPSDVAFEVSKSISSDQTRFINKEAFYKLESFNDTIDSKDVIFYPNDATGVLEVRIYIQKNQTSIGSERVYSQFFTGFKKVTNSTTVEFGWIPQSQVSGQLLNQDIEDVSVQNVIDLYLINIPLFKEAVLSADNVSIQIDPKNNSNLLVYVTIPLFNQDQVNPGTQTFVTSISGFGRVAPQNIADFTAPDNFTVLISVLLVSILAVTTGVVLMTILIRQFSLKKIKKPQIDLKKKKIKK